MTDTSSPTAGPRVRTSASSRTTRRRSPGSRRSRSAVGTGDGCTRTRTSPGRAARRRARSAVSVSVDLQRLSAGLNGQRLRRQIGGDQPRSQQWRRTESPNGVWTISGLSNNNVAGTFRHVLGQLDVHERRQREWRSLRRSRRAGATVQSLFLGNRTNAGLLTLVRTSEHRPSLRWVTRRADRRGSGAADTGADGITTIYPTVGLESSLYVGQQRVLRSSAHNARLRPRHVEPDDSQSIDCEPNRADRDTTSIMFRTAATPWYTDNDLQARPMVAYQPPRPGAVPRQERDPAPAEQPGNAWHCVLKAPGFSPTSSATASPPRSATARRIRTTRATKYAASTRTTTTRRTRTSGRSPDGRASPRVVFLFIVPYGAYKNTGSQRRIPILNFAAFYVTGWSGQWRLRQESLRQTRSTTGPPAPISLTR